MLQLPFLRLYLDKVPLLTRMCLYVFVQFLFLFKRTQAHSSEALFRYETVLNLAPGWSYLKRTLAIRLRQEWH
jgi:hypothetical protein